MIKIDKFETKAKLYKEIAAMSADQNISYIDAAIAYAEQNDLEVEFVASILSKNDLIRSKIEEEAEDLNFLKKKARLPI